MLTLLRCGFIILCLAVTGLSRPAFAQPNTCGPGNVPEFGKWFTLAPVVLLSSDQSSQIVPLPAGAPISAVRLKLNVDPGKSSRWNLIIRDATYRVLASVGASDFGAPASEWTGLLQTSTLLLDLVAEPDADVRVTIDQGIAYPKFSSGRLFSIVNPGYPWKELYSAGAAIEKRSGDSVGMLVAGIARDGERTSWCCSGVMIGPDLFLTNWHCGGSRDAHMIDEEYWSAEVCANAIIDLNWVENGLGRKLRCKEVVGKPHKQLDFAVLRLGNILGPSASIGEPIYAKVTLRQPKVGEDIFLIHHSQCMPKLVSSSCKVKSVETLPWLSGSEVENTYTDFAHNCNSESGASGGAIFDSGGHFIGLHHLGAENAKLCQVSFGDNKAVKILEIVKSLLKDDVKETGEEFFLLSRLKLNERGNE